jgi:hypothetical protein
MADPCARETRAFVSPSDGYIIRATSHLGGTMTDIVSAILIGLVMGALGRLVVPGKQHIPIC